MKIVKKIFYSKRMSSQHFDSFRGKLCNHIHSFVVAEFWKCSLLVISEASNSGSTTFESTGVLCRLYTLAECIWRESWARVALDKTG